MKNSKHYGAALTAFVLWGVFSIPLRALQKYGVGEILYFRIFMSAAILILILFTSRKKVMQQEVEKFRLLTKNNKLKVAGLTLVGSLLLTVNWVIFIYTVNHINIKTASFSYLICPVMTAILGAVLLKEKLTMLQWLAVGICTISCILMGINSVSEFGYSFFTAITYALYLISQRLNQGQDRLFGLGIQVVFSFIILNLIFNQLVKTVPVDLYFYMIIAIIAVVFTVIPLFLNLYALNKIKSATIGILMYINPIFNFVIAIAVYHEIINSLQIIGYLLIFVALIIFNFANIKNLTSNKVFSSN